MTKALVIAAFPGVGKSFLTSTDTSRTYLDLDSSAFSKLKDGSISPFFPDNYIRAILDAIQTYDVVFVSTHDIVTAELRRTNINYTLVFPDFKYKQEYLDIYKRRGDNERFINFIDRNWTDFIKGLENQDVPKFIVGYDVNRMRNVINTIVKSKGYITI